MMITVNSGLLDKWIQTTEDGMSQLMKATGLSFHTLDRMRRGKYLSAPYKSTRKLICLATGFSESELFPTVGSEVKDAA